MTAFAALWLPIVLSTVAVFIASSVINAVLPWHKNDFAKLPDEDRFMNAVRPMGIPRGEYMVPRCLRREELKSPEFIQKMNDGPVMTMTVFPNGPISMGKSLGLWALYCLFISGLAGCVAGSILAPGAESHAIFHYTAIIAVSCYVVALWQTSIWYGRPWLTTLKGTLDGIIYAAITAGIFVWFWPA